MSWGFGKELKALYREAKAMKRSSSKEGVA